MAPVIVSKRGILELVLWVLKGRNGCRVIIRIETGHSNLVSCFGPRMRALAKVFYRGESRGKIPCQRPNPRAKTWHKIWMTDLNPTIKTQRISGTESPADCMPADKPTELSRIKLKTWTRQPVPMISEHSAHSMYHYLFFSFFNVFNPSTYVYNQVKIQLK